MKENQVKGVTISIFTILSSCLGILAIPVLILIVANMIDYATGLTAAKYRAEKINSYKSFKGIAKKVCMWLLVCVGVLVDVFLIYTGSSIGLNPPKLFIIACFVTAWLFVNELISILENMVDIGVNMPPFLLPFVKNIKSQVEGKAASELTNIVKEKKEE